jgi:hypothetical protein
VLAAGPAAATTDVEDVGGGPPGGCWRQVRQRPPPMLKTSMAGPLGVAVGISGSGHHRSLKTSMAGPLRVLAAGPAAATTDVEDVDGGPPGGCWRPRAPAACTEPQIPLIIIGLGQFSASLAGEVNNALVRGVHRPDPQPPIRKRQGNGAHMLRVQNQAKQVVSSRLPLAVVVARGDL